MSTFLKHSHYETKRIGKKVYLDLIYTSNKNGTGSIFIKSEGLDEKEEIFIHKIKISSLYEMYDETGLITEKLEYEINNFTKKSFSNLRNIVNKEKGTLVKIKIPNEINFSKKDSKDYIRQDFEATLYISFYSKQKTNEYQFKELILTTRIKSDNSI